MKKIIQGDCIEKIKEKTIKILNRYNSYKRGGKKKVFNLTVKYGRYQKISSLLDIWLVCLLWTVGYKEKKDVFVLRKSKVIALSFEKNQKAKAVKSFKELCKLVEDYTEENNVLRGNLGNKIRL